MADRFAFIKMLILSLVFVCFGLTIAQAQDGSFTGDRAGAAALLQQFMDQDVDHRELTLKLKPSTKDYEAVFKQPLAGKLESAHQSLWRSERTAIRPKRNQTELLLTVTTTDGLIAKNKDLGDFPGGYKKILPYLKPGFTIARFKFVAPGKWIGSAFDGLVYVNGRWVLIPKPWRALP